MKAELCAKCEQPIGAIRVSTRVTIVELDGDGAPGEALKKRTDYCSYGCALLGMGGLDRVVLERLANEFAGQESADGIDRAETSIETDGYYDGLAAAANRIREVSAGGPVVVSMTDLTIPEEWVDSGA